jgi:hypothetical protein
MLMEKAIQELVVPAVTVKTTVTDIELEQQARPVILITPPERRCKPKLHIAINQDGLLVTV